MYRINQKIYISKTLDKTQEAKTYLNDIMQNRGSGFLCLPLPPFDSLKVFPHPRIFMFLLQLTLSRWMENLKKWNRRFTKTRGHLRGENPKIPKAKWPKVKGPSMVKGNPRAKGEKDPKTWMLLCLRGRG